MYQVTSLFKMIDLRSKAKKQVFLNPNVIGATYALIDKNGKKNNRHLEVFDTLWTVERNVLLDKQSTYS